MKTRRYLYLTPCKIVERSGDHVDRILYQEFVKNSKIITKLLNIIGSRNRSEKLLKTVNPLERKILGFDEKNVSSFWYAVLRNIHAGEGASFGPIVEKILESFLKLSNEFECVKRGKDINEMVGKKGNKRRIDFVVIKGKEIFFIELRQSVKTGGGTSRGSLFDKLKIIINNQDSLKNYDRITYGIVALFDEDGMWTRSLSSPRWESLKNKLFEEIRLQLDCKRGNTKWKFTLKKALGLPLDIVFYSAYAWFKEFFNKEPDEFLDTLKVYMDFSILYEGIIRGIDNCEEYDYVINMCRDNTDENNNVLKEPLKCFKQKYLSSDVNGHSIDEWSEIVETFQATIQSKLTDLSNFGKLPSLTLKNLSFICLYIFVKQLKLSEKLDQTECFNF